MKRINIRALLSGMVAAVAVVAGMTLPANRAQATPALVFTKLAVQPQAAVGLGGYNGQTWDASIHAFAFTGDRMVAGYGDWGFNSDSYGGPDGRTAIRPFNLTTRKWGTLTYTRTESNDVFRTLGGKIYAPTTDPTGTGPGGYATMANGNWQAEFPMGLTPAVHIFDIAALDAAGTDLWAFGSVRTPLSPPGADETLGAIWRSTNSGQTWSAVRQHPLTAAPGSLGAGRYMTGVAYKGKVYTRYYPAGYPTTAVPAIEAYDKATNTWIVKPDQQPCFNRPEEVTVFDGKIICGTFRNGPLAIYDGETLSAQFLPAGSAKVISMYKNAGYLYLLAENGVVMRSTKLAGPWEVTGTVTLPPGAAVRSIGVYRGVVYIGDSQANIWRAPLSL